MALYFKLKHNKITNLKTYLKHNILLKLIYFDFVETKRKEKV